MADLDQLAAAADGIPDPEDQGAESGAPGAPGGPVAAPEPGNFEAVAFMLAAFREVAGSILNVRSLQTTLADDKVEKCARVLAPVADKYGLQLGGLLGGPEAAAVMVAGPILWAAWRALDAELSARRKAPPQAVAEDTGPAAPAGVVPPGGD